MLLAANKWDPATEYSRKWALRLAKEIKFTTVLEPDEVTRANADKHIPNHQLITFYNHGNETALIGQGGNTNFIDKGNAHLLKDKAVYVMACLWGKNGGVHAWQQGASAVWAYTEVYGFVTTEEKLFSQQANYGLVTKIQQDLTWEQAFAKSIEKDTELIEQAQDVWSKVWLQRNRDCKVLYTENRPPQTSSCTFRRLGLRLFGVKRGWNLSWNRIAAVTFALVGYGVSLHDYMHSLWQLGEMYMLQGGYIGFIMMLIGGLLVARKTVKR